MGMDPTYEKGIKQLNAWHSPMAKVLEDLRFMAGSTEEDFLAIGSRLQDVYMETMQLAETADQLVQVASGEQISDLISRCYRIVEKIGDYLMETQNSGGNGIEVLGNVEGLLRKAAGPLDGFKRMSKQLYMLEVSIKIESSYLGDTGSEFVNLALDIKKLTQQIKEKSGDLHDHQQLLMRLVSANISRLQNTQTHQSSGLDSTMNAMNQSIAGLQSANEQFAGLGQEISGMSTENSQYLSNVVHSMQFHDIFRQQVEHVIEALEILEPHLQHGSFHVIKDNDGDSFEEAMGRVGDVCELQEAQLRFAVNDFYEAVQTIVSSLNDIAGKQHELAGSVVSRLGNSKSGTSFVDEVRGYMQDSSTVLEGFAGQNSEMVGTMEEVSRTVQQMTEYVAIIEEIGNEIIAISLNARIKASGTGREGDSLSVLAEEIGFLSGDAVNQTEAITRTLTEINVATSQLTTDVHGLESNLAEKLIDLENESGTILSVLENMGAELQGLMHRVQDQSKKVAGLIEGLCRSITIHEKIKNSGNKSLDFLQEVYRGARQHVPAGSDFKEELQRIAESYTMESERRIHDLIYHRHGIQEQDSEDVSTPDDISDSEFGDNVDLF